MLYWDEEMKRPYKRKYGGEAQRRARDDNYKFANSSREANVARLKRTGTIKIVRMNCEKCKESKFCDYVTQICSDCSESKSNF